MEQPTAEETEFDKIFGGIKDVINDSEIADFYLQLIKEYTNSEASAAVSKLSAKILPILESMDSKLLDRQKIGGFETFFDFMGEDIESIKSLLSNLKEDLYQTDNPNLPKYVSSTNVITNGMDRAILLMWQEIENWYGDPQKKETGEQLLKRLQSQFHIKLSNPSNTKL